MKSIGHFINGKEVPGKSNNSGQIFNPATGEVQAEVAYATRDELNEGSSWQISLNQSGPKSILKSVLE